MHHKLCAGTALSNGFWRERCFSLYLCALPSSRPFSKACLLSGRGGVAVIKNETIKCWKSLSITINIQRIFIYFFIVSNQSFGTNTYQMFIYKRVINDCGYVISEYHCEGGAEATQYPPFPFLAKKREHTHKGVLSKNYTVQNKKIMLS